MSKIEAGTKVSSVLSIKEVKMMPQQNGFIVLTEPSEHNPTGVWRFADKQATQQLVSTGIRGAKEDMEGSILELRALVALSNSLKQPVKLAYDATYGVEGETFADPNTAEVRKYKKTGWNCFVTATTLGAAATEELSHVNREIGLQSKVAAEIAKQYAKPARRSYADAPVFETTKAEEHETVG